MRKIHDFYERLIAHIIDTMGELKEKNRYVQFTLDECGIRTDLVRADDNQKNWGLNELIEEIRKWTEKNPVETLERSGRLFKEQDQREHIILTHQNTKTRECVYCASKDSKPIACTRIQENASILNIGRSKYTSAVNVAEFQTYHSSTNAMITQGFEYA